MHINKDERRTCIRFKIPGALVSHKQIKFFSFAKGYEEHSCPVEEISRAGIGFLCINKFEMNARLKIRVEIPPENFYQVFIGHVKRVSKHSGSNFGYRIGVQFSSYGMKKEENHPKLLEKIIILEKKYSKPT